MDKIMREKKANATNDIRCDSGCDRACYWALRAQKVAVSLHRQKNKTSSGRQGIFDMLEQIF